MPDIVTSRTFVDGEKGITATKLNDIIGSSVIQPAFYSAKAASSTLDPTDQLLELKGSGSYATITGSQLISSVSSSVTANIQPVIWSTRLRSFNAVSNSTFEVDQRNVGAGLTNPASAAFLLDRYTLRKTLSTGTVNVALQDASTAPIVIPGTSFGITSKFLRFTVGTAQASLAAGDVYAFNHYIEGPRWRELSMDVHSVSVLVRSSVAGLAFSVALRDPTATPIRSLSKLCTISSANTWTLLTMANIPVWASGGAWTAAAGSLAYNLSICLASGTTLTPAANDAWQNGNFMGAVGQSNFLATAGATFDIAYLSHEPGSQCSNPPLDCPFTANLDDCLRYFQKSYLYGTAVGAVSNLGAFNMSMAANFNPWSYIPFKKVMAKVPTVTGYSNVTGAINNVRDATGSIDRAISSSVTVGDGSFSGFSLTAVPAAVWQGQFHYIADTGL